MNLEDVMRMKNAVEVYFSSFSEIAPPESDEFTTHHASAAAASFRT